MKALMFYDLFFGNTEKIARAIGKALEKFKPEILHPYDLYSSCQLLQHRVNFRIHPCVVFFCMQHNIKQERIE
jgi:flavodoxin